MNIDPVFLSVLFEEAVDLSVVDYYDRSDYYYSTCGRPQDSVAIESAALLRELYVAEACFIYVTPVDDPTRPGWISVILDEGYPRVSDYSCNIKSAVEQAMSKAELAAAGKLAVTVTIEDTNA